MEDQMRNGGLEFARMECHSRMRFVRIFLFVNQIILTKNFCLVLSTVSIVLAWFLALIPLCVSIPLTVTASRSNKSSSTGESTLSTRLPPINLSNGSTNYTIERVECENSFIYSSADNICYPPCNWDAQGRSLALTEQFVFSVVSITGILLNLGTLLGWLFTHFINLRTCRLTREFHVPRASLFTVFLCNSGLLTSYAIVDLMGRDVIFCSLAASGRLYLPAHLVLSYDIPHADKIAMNVLGVLNFFFFLATLLWLMNAFINMALVVYFPLQINKDLKTRIVVFTVQCIYAFGLPILLIFIAVAAHPNSPFGSSYMLHQVLISTEWAYIFLYKWPYFILAAAISTIMVLILAKLRFVSIENKSLGRAIQLTEIEKRLIAYAFLFTLTLVIIGSGFSGLYVISLYYYKIIEDYILCITINSPIYILPFGVNTANATVAYRENSYGGLDECRMLLDSANQITPPIAVFLFSLCTRLVWFHFNSISGFVVAPN